MGKSLGNALYLSDDFETINEKVKGAKTDPNRIRKTDKGNPDICMVYYYHKLFSNKEECENICQECKEGKRGCVYCKKELAENINKELEPIREKRHYYENHEDEVKNILLEGTKHAREISKETLTKVKKSMKIDYSD